MSFTIVDGHAIKVGKMTTCLRCHKPLTDPASMERGLGPICAAIRDSAVAHEESMKSIPPKYWPDFDYRSAAADIASRQDEATYISEISEDGGISTFKKMDNGAIILLPHIMYHSPTGMNYGYSGSGPADLARSVLSHAVGLEIADRLYQDFKQEFVAASKDRFSVSLSTIQGWVVKKLSE
jgi:hypothetical protein